MVKIVKESQKTILWWAGHTSSWKLVVAHNSIEFILYEILYKIITVYMWEKYNII
jgi:hypothetical protein